MTQTASSLRSRLLPAATFNGRPGLMVRSLTPQLGLLAAAVALARLDLPSEPGRVASVAALFLLLFVPGGLLLRVLDLPQQPWTAANALRLLLGLTFYVVIAYPLLLLEAPFVALDISYGTFTLLLVLVLMSPISRNSLPQPNLSIFLVRRYRWLSISGFVLCSLLFFLLVDGQRTPDIWPHVTSINRYLDAGSLEHIGSAREDVNAWPASWAYMARLIGAPAPELYTDYMPLLLGGIAVLAWLGLAKTLFVQPRLVLIGALVQSLVILASLSSEHTRSFFDLAGEDKGFIAGPLFFVAQALAIRFSRSLEPRALVGLLVIGATAALIHPAMGALVGISVLATVVVLGGGRLRRLRLSARSLALVGAAAAVAMAVSMVGYLYLHNDISSLFEPGRVRLPDRLLFISGSWFIASPRLLLDPLILLNLAATLVFVSRWRHDPLSRYLAAQNILILAIAFNPLAARALGALITPLMVWRLVWLLPTALGLTHLLWLARARMRLEGRRGKRFPVVLARYSAAGGVALLLLAVAIGDGANIGDRWEERHATTPDLSGVSELVSTLERDLPDGTLVAAPPKISPYLGAYTRGVRFLYQGRPRLGTVDPAGERLTEDTISLYRTENLHLDELFAYSDRYRVNDFVVSPQAASCWMEETEDVPLFIRVTREGDYDLRFVAPERSILVSPNEAAGPPRLGEGSDSGALDNDGVTRDDQPSFTGDGTPGYLVEVFLDDQLVGFAEVACDGRYRLAPFSIESVAEGEHELKARLRDYQGSTGPFSEASSFVIDREAPSVPSAPALADTDGCDSFRNPPRSGERPSLAGDTEPGSIVTVIDGTAELGDVVADASGHWVYESQTLSRGTHSLRVEATDPAGNESQKSPVLRLRVARDCGSD